MKRANGLLANSHRINAAVRQLQKCGMEVRSTRVGIIRPVIEIERPDGMCQGFDITCRAQGQTRQMRVASLCGCLVTWRA
ncbi:hypothetical protein [Photobacterium sp.]|uniref:hypothetical protein n=1 Tax=Photobacterium sp. TaxID=660 RepID=UPI00299D6F0F|nr:hypothetical protein [Photobacterium sp.]MDX1301218.1 hypothetical protein [Photobacterium sp.]